MNARAERIKNGGHEWKTRSLILRDVSFRCVVFSPLCEHNKFTRPYILYYVALWIFILWKHTSRCNRINKCIPLPARGARPPTKALIICEARLIAPHNICGFYVQARALVSRASYTEYHKMHRKAAKQLQTKLFNVWANTIALQPQCRHSPCLYLYHNRRAHEETCKNHKAVAPIAIKPPAENICGRTTHASLM